MDSIFKKIQAHYEELSATEQLVIDFILKYDDIENLKLKVIERNLHTSASTIIRAVKKLNYTSFTDFKYALVNSRRYDNGFTSKDSYQEVINLICSDFNRTIEMIDRKTVFEIASIIRESRKIFVVGVGSSSSVVNSLNKKLKNIGLWSNDYTEIFPIRDIPDVASKDDCLLLFSLSGDEEHIVNLATECKLKGTNIISVTGFSSNQLTKYSDIQLFVHQSSQNRKKLRSRLMLNVASEIIFETILLIE